MFDVMKLYFNLYHSDCYDNNGFEVFYKSNNNNNKKKYKCQG